VPRRSDREAKARSVVSELGFQAAEIRALHAQLADACAWQDRDVVCDLAEDLITRHRAFAATYRGLLCIAVSTRPACTAPAERMSV
jgi:hypothetical protein